MTGRKMNVDVSTVFKSTVVILLTLLGAYILFIGAQIIVTFLIAIIIASAVRPAINALTKIRIPESLAIIFVYSVMALSVLLILFVLIPPMLNQMAIYLEQDWRLASRIIYAQQLAERFVSDFTHEDVSMVSPDQIRNAVSTTIADFRSIMPRLIQNLGNIAANAALIFVMGAYWLTSHISAKRFILKLTSPRYRDETRHIIHDIEHTMGKYVRGVVIISFIVGLLNFVPMYLLGVPNAITMAFIIGLFTAVPMIGGLIGGGIATLLTLVNDPTSAFVVLITFLIVNQIETYILQPRIMSDEVGMNPLLVIIYTSVGFVLAGIVGALVAVPLMGVLHILLEHLVIEPYRAAMYDDTPEDEIVVEIDPETYDLEDTKRKNDDSDAELPINPLA